MRRMSVDEVGTKLVKKEKEIEREKKKGFSRGTVFVGWIGGWLGEWVDGEGERGCCSW